jgi:hypothetical protein
MHMHVSYNYIILVAVLLYVDSRVRWRQVRTQEFSERRAQLFEEEAHRGEKNFSLPKIYFSGTPTDICSPEEGGPPPSVRAWVEKFVLEHKVLWLRSYMYSSNDFQF